MLEYGSVKAVISVKVNGKEVSKYSTFQGFIVEAVLKSAQCRDMIKDGDEFDVKIDMKSIPKENPDKNYKNIFFKD